MFRQQQDAHRQDPYPSLTIRKDRLERVIDMMVRNEALICDAAQTDFACRSAINTQGSDILPVIEACQYAKKQLPRWMLSQARKSRFPLGLIGAKSKVEYQPLGVVGNISTWNFPVQLMLAPLAGIFSAGNRAMLKPSELSDHTSNLLAELIAESFDKTELTAVTGGPEVAAQFSSLPFDHLMFTGSTKIGKLVAQAAAVNLVPLTLELGGKNPAIVSRESDIQLATKKIMWGKVLNGGQICLSPDTAFIPNDKLDEFTSACKQSVRDMFSDISTDADFTHAISEQHALRLNELVAEAERNGAQIIPLAKSNGRSVPPTLIVNPPENCRVMTEEVFGGPLPIVTYNDFQDVIKFVNTRPKALALYYFGKNKHEIRQLTYQTSSGGLVVNDCFAHHLQEDLPFGGVGDSGMGAYHGYDGFKNFSHARAVYTQSSLDPFRLLRPPYGRLIRKYFAKQISGSNR